MERRRGDVEEDDGGVDGAVTGAAGAGAATLRHLLAWREHEASASRTFAHCVLPLPMASRLSREQPRSEEAVSALLGPARARQYAKQVVRVMSHGFEAPPLSEAAKSAETRSIRDGPSAAVGRGPVWMPPNDGSRSVQAGASSGRAGSTKQQQAHINLNKKQPREVIEVLSSDEDFAAEEDMGRHKKNGKAG